MPAMRLHDRQRPLVAVVAVGHRQAVGERGDRVPPAELGTRRAVGDRLPDQLARVGVGAAAAARRRATSGRCSPWRSRAAGWRAAAVAARRVPGSTSETLIVPSSATSTACVRTSSSPSTHATVADPELPVVPRAGEQLAVELTGVRPYPSCGQALSRAWTPLDVCTRHSRRPSTLTSFMRADRELGQIADDRGCPWTSQRSVTSMSRHARYDFKYR